MLGTKGDGKKFRLSPDAVTDTHAVLAIRGAGKTYTASVMAEQMLSTGQQIVAIDPTGAWWGLRHSADGKKPGFPVVVFGGDNGDLPLSELSGETIASAIVAKRFSAVLDVGLFTKAKMNRFLVDFLRELYRRNREPMHLFVDEADDIAPQRVMGDKARLVGAIEDVVKTTAVKPYKAKLADVARRLGQPMALLTVISEQAAKAAENGQAQAVVSAPPVSKTPRIVRDSIPSSAAGDAVSVKLGRCERAILAGLAQYPNGKPQHELGVVTGYSHKGGGFNNAVSRLRSQELIEGSRDRLSLTSEGQAVAPEPLLATGQKLLDHWLRQLGKCERAILSFLVERGAATKSEIADATNYAPGGGGFNNAVSRLRTLELISGKDTLQAAIAFTASEAFA